MRVLGNSRAAGREEPECLESTASGFLMRWENGNSKISNRDVVRSPADLMDGGGAN